MGSSARFQTLVTIPMMMPTYKTKNTTIKTFHMALSWGCGFTSPLFAVLVGIAVNWTLVWQSCSSVFAVLRWKYSSRLREASSYQRRVSSYLRQSSSISHLRSKILPRWPTVKSGDLACESWFVWRRRCERYRPNDERQLDLLERDRVAYRDSGALGRRPTGLGVSACRFRLERFESASHSSQAVDDEGRGADASLPRSVVPANLRSCSGGHERADRAGKRAVAAAAVVDALMLRSEGRRLRAAGPARRRGPCDRRSRPPSVRCWDNDMKTCRYVGLVGKGRS